MLSAEFSNKNRGAKGQCPKSSVQVQVSFSQRRYPRWGRKIPHQMFPSPSPLMFFPVILVTLVPCWEDVVCQVPRERSSAEKIWESSWLPDRLWRDLIGVQEAAWPLGEHTQPSQRHCSPTRECFLTAIMPCSQMAAWHCPALWSQGPPGVGILSLPLLFQTSRDQDWKRHFQAVFSVCSLHLQR